MMQNRTRTMVYMAFLIALSIVLTRLFSLRIPIGGIEGIRIGLGALPMIFAGIAFGPVYGGIVGAVSDLIGFFINPLGGYVPHFTLTAFLTGFIPGAVIHFMVKSTNKYWPILGAIIIGEVSTSVILVPFFLQRLFGIPLATTVIPNMVAVAIQAPFYTYFIRFLINFKPLESITKSKFS